VADQLSGKIPYILDGGPCSIGLESTIVGWEDNMVVVYRLGGISLESIRQVAGQVTEILNQSSNPNAPGMLKSHYAPRKPLYLNTLPEKIQKKGTRKIGVLCLNQPPDAANIQEVIFLSQQGDLNEAARNLFSALRQLDQMDIDIILATSVPEEGLGKAINDRLRRAAAPHS
jgi:L-threonylcarbamoyladenylate synthase